MGAPMTEPRQAVAFTYADLRSAPDDGYRRELVEGQLLVSPAPDTVHQRCVIELIVLLRQTLPPHLEVSAAPVDVKFSDATVLEPDVLVVRREEVGGPCFTRPPELVVEVFSPSTRLTDQTLKRAAYEAAGVSAYWMVDPAVPAVTVLELENGRYVERATVTGVRSWQASRPFPVVVVPDHLVRPPGSP
jgi:Uma2 family endonuclease